MQFVAAFWHVLLKARSACLQGLCFHSPGGLCRYVFRTMQNPWLLSAFPSMTKQERRAQRLHCPSPVGDGVTLYRSDGACRGQGQGDSSHSGSFAAIRWEAGVETGRCAMIIAETTNNRAEYGRLLSSLKDAIGRLPTEAVFQVDSQLIQRQVTGIWKCHSPELIPLYTDCMQCIATLRRSGCQCRVDHIFREFNAAADSLANHVLNTGLSVRVNWMGRALL